MEQNTEKLKKMLAKYNTKAKKWEYDELTYDEVKKELVGKLVTKADKIEKTLFNYLKYAYRDGYMLEEKEKLQKFIDKNLKNGKKQ